MNRPLLFGQLDGLDAIGGLEDAIAMRLENTTGQHAHRRVVFNEQNRFCAAERRLWRLDGRLVQGLIDAWEIDLEARTVPHFAVRRDVASTLLDDAVHGRQAESRSLARSLRGEA